MILARLPGYNSADMAGPSVRGDPISVLESGGLSFRRQEKAERMIL